MTKQHTINLAAPSKTEQAKLAAMSEEERRAFLKSEILEGFRGKPRKVSAADIKASVLKKISVNA